MRIPANTVKARPGVKPAPAVQAASGVPAEVQAVTAEPEVVPAVEVPAPTTEAVTVPAIVSDTPAPTATIAPVAATRTPRRS